MRRPGDSDSRLPPGLSRRPRSDPSGSWRPSLGIAGAYLIFAAVWIGVSDAVAHAVATDRESLTRLQTAKGWLFVGLSALLLFLLIRRVLISMHDSAIAGADAAGLLESMFEASPVGIVVASESDRILRTNRAFRSMLGFDESQLRGLRLTDLLRTDTGSAARAAASEASPVEMTREDGASAWVHLTELPYRSTDGPSGKLWTVQDVTRQHDAEERHRRLETQVARSQKLEAVGRLAAGIAHDFNNLLGVIGNYASFIETELEEGDPRQQDIREILNATKRGTTLVQQLLAFSRTGPGDLVALDLADVIRAMEPLLVRMAGRNVTIEFHLDPDVPPITGDVSYLERVLMNLVVNARDAMPAGGVLQISTATREVRRVNGTDPDLAPGTYARLCVRDTGEGMTPEVMAQIFDPFFTTKGDERGSGLGLSTVYGLVRQLRGSISVESKPGRGTTFEILLPLERPGQQAFDT